MEVDNTVNFELGKTYGISVRRVAGQSTYSVFGSGGTNTLILQTAIPIADAPSVGDLYSFGESSRETVELLVKSITFSRNLSARLELIDYNDAVLYCRK